MQLEARTRLSSDLYSICTTSHKLLETRPQTTAIAKRMSETSIAPRQAVNAQPDPERVQSVVSTSSRDLSGGMTSHVCEIRSLLDGVCLIKWTVITRDLTPFSTTLMIGDVQACMFSSCSDVSGRGFNSLSGTATRRVSSYESVRIVVSLHCSQDLQCGSSISDCKDLIHKQLTWMSIVKVSD